MYWYPISQEEEEQAWNQAEAQAAEYGSEKWDGAAKFVGNLGELVIDQFLIDSAPEDSWEYLNSDAMKNAKPEFNEYDFEFINGLKIDVKSTVDLRKFSPAYAYNDSNDKVGLGPSQSGFPTVDSDSDADVFIFVLLHTPEKPSPIPNDLEESDMGWVEDSEHTGNYLAVILGWMFTESFQGEAFSNHMWRTPGKFTRFNVRDMYELLIKSGLKEA